MCCLLILPPTEHPAALQGLLREKKADTGQSVSARISDMQPFVIFYIHVASVYGNV